MAFGVFGRLPRTTSRLSRGKAEGSLLETEGGTERPGTSYGTHEDGDVRKDATLKGIPGNYMR